MFPAPSKEWGCYEYGETKQQALDQSSKMQTEEVKKTQSSRSTFYSSAIKH